MTAARRGFFHGFGNGTVAPTVAASLPAGSAAGDRFLAIAVVNGTNGSALSNPNTTDHPGLVVSGPAGSNNNSNAIVITGLLTAADITAGTLTTTWAVSGRPAVAGVVFVGDPCDATASAGPVIFSTVALAVTANTVTTLDDNADVFEVIAFNETGVAPTVSWPAGYNVGDQASTTAGSGANMTAAIGYLGTLGAAGTYGGGAITASGATGPHSWTVALNLPAVGAATIAAASPSMSGSATTSSPGGTAAAITAAAAAVAASATTALGGTAAIAANTGHLTVGAGGYFEFTPGQIGVIGDSLTYQYGNGATDIPTAFAARGWNASLINAVGVTGRQIWAGGTSPFTKDTIDTWRSAGFDPYLYVLPLGANMADSGSSIAQNTADWLSLLAYIGPGRKCYVIGIGYQTAGEGATSFNSGGTLGSRYSAVGNASSPNVAILNLIDAGLDPKVYPTVVFCDWDGSTEAATARAGGTTYWLSTDASSPSGTARHMTVIGYQNLKNVFVARMLDGELNQASAAIVATSPSMSAAATRTALGGAALAAASPSLTATATQATFAVAAITATTASLSATPVITRLGAAAVQAPAGILSATPTLTAQITALIAAAAATVSATPSLTTQALAAITAAGPAVSATAVRTTPGAASINAAPGTLAAAAALTAQIAALVAAAGATVNAGGGVTSPGQGAASITASPAALTATPTVTTAAAAVITASSAAVAAAAFLAPAGAATITAAGPQLSAAAVRQAQAAAALASAAASLVAGATTGGAPSASIVATGTVLAAAFVQALAAVAISAHAALTGSATNLGGGSGAAPPASRTFAIPAQDRTFLIASEGTRAELVRA